MPLKNENNPVSLQVDGGLKEIPNRKRGNPLALSMGRKSRSYNAMHCTNPIKYTTLQYQKIKPYVDSIALLRIEVFRDWPYLYDGTMEYEQTYLTMYKHPTSIWMIAEDKGKVVGAVTGVSLVHTDEEIVAAFKRAGLDPNDMFYLGEILLLPEYRGKGSRQR